MRAVLVIGTLLFGWACSDAPWGDGGNRADLRVEYALAVPTSSTAAIVTWRCSAEAPGAVLYGQGAYQSARVSPLEARDHTLPLDDLVAGRGYVYQVVCGSGSGAVYGLPQTFSTLLLHDRAIWLVGGLGFGNTIVGSIDIFDPLTESWIANVTSMPTPRAFAAVAVLDGKIYVMGGVTGQSGSFVPSALVEAYDPAAGTWSTPASMPVTLQGAVATAAGDSIYVTGGSTTTDMTTGTLLNQVYRFQPGAGTTGTWTTLTSGTAVFPRIDMSGCGVGGALYMTGGRYFSSGAPFSTADAYTPGANATTALVESPLNTARHGAGVACYRPAQGDPGALDPTAVLIVGGSTSTNTAQPASFISPTSAYDYYAIGGSTNSMQAGPSLPVALYFPAVQIGYASRRAYVFGGATGINTPTTTVYALDLTSPVAGSWASVPAAMPTARYAHRAVVIDR